MPDTRALKWSKRFFIFALCLCGGIVALIQIATKNVKFDVSVVTENNMPAVSIKTNLPEGLEISISLAKGNAENGEAGTIVANAQRATVKSGSISYAPFTHNGKPFPGGAYVAWLTTIPWKNQPEQIQKVLKLYDIKSEFLDREVKFKLPDISKNDGELWLALGR